MSKHLKKFDLIIFISLSTQIISEINFWNHLKHKYSQVQLKCNQVVHVITYSTVMTIAESESDFRITTDNPYLTLMG